MTCTKSAARTVFSTLAFIISVAFAPSASAQWADFRYQNRTAITVANPSAHAFASGDIVTATLPVGTLSGVRSDGADVALYQGSTAVPVKVLSMGGSLKALLQLPSPLAAILPYTITENLSAGKTSYAALPAGTRLDFADNDDDAYRTVTLPFNFPFKPGQASNKLTINLDGFVTPGPTDAGRPDSVAAALTKYVIMPYASDYQITSAPATGVYVDLSNPAQATIRWEVCPSGQTTLVARFALILKPNGDIRFVYGTPCAQDTISVDWSVPKYGVAVGDAQQSVVTDASGADFGNHDDISYTVAIPTPPSQTFSLYYNGPSVTAGSTAPAAVQSWDFSDGQMHGWRSHQDPVGNSDLSIVKDVDGVNSLRLDSSKETVKSLPWASPSNMTPLGDQTVYWKVRRPDPPNTASFPAMRFIPVTLTDLNNLSYITVSGAAIGFQFGENYNAGGFLTAEYFTPADPPYDNGRTPANDHQFTNHTWTSNPVSSDSNQFFVTSCWDTNGTTMLGGKGWQSPLTSPTAGSDPMVSGYTMTWDTSSDSGVVSQPVAPGIIAWQHWTGSALLKWVCAIPGGFAERVSTSLATAETAPNPGTGKAVIQGVAYDAAIGIGTPMGGVTITVKDPANNVLATYVTDASGRYRLVINATATATLITAVATKPGLKGTATQSVVENNTYTVNIPLAFGARAQGIVYDTQTNGGVVGATINLLTPGTTTVVFTTTTDSYGRYILDMDTAGTYDVAVSAGAYTPQTLAGVAYVPQSVVTRDFGLIAPELLANGGFETEAPVVDPAGNPGALRPAGWTTWDQQETAVTAAITNDASLLDSEVDSTMTFYLNDASLARTGTHCVAIKRISGVGSTSVQWMSDTGALIPVAPGQQYRVSVWAKGAHGMQVRARIRFSTTNFAASSASVVLTGSDTTFYADGTGGRWQPFSAIITAPSSPAFMIVRIYGTFVGYGMAPQVVFFDDVSVKPISPRVITGTVVNGAAAPVGNIGVGANLNRPGMTDPAYSATSSTAAASLGTFTLNLLDKGAYNVQAYQPGYMAGPQLTLDTAASYAVPTPITLVAPATPALNVAVGAKVSSTDAAGDNPEVYMSVGDILGFDGSNVYRGGGQWSQWRTQGNLDWTTVMPITITADLGRAYTFSQMTWVWAWSRGGPMSYDIQTSLDGTTFTNAYQATGTGGMVWRINTSTDNTHSCIQLASPVTARYVRMILHSVDRTSGSNLGFSEFRVDLPAADVTGTVARIGGAPVNGAYVGFRGGSGSLVSLGTTDATGAYTIPLPTNNQLGVVAHYLPDADNVVAISDPFDAVASASSTVTLPTITVGDPVANLVPLGAVTYSEPAIDEGGNPATNGSDHNFTTRWGTDMGAQIRPDNTVGFVWDLGVPKTFNQANILWEYGFGEWYVIETSPDAVTWTPVLTNHSNYSGYTAATGRFVDVQSLPTTTARYVRVLVQWNETQWTSVWELQLARVSANPVPPFTLTKQALKIAAGIVSATSADMSTLNVATGGSSSSIDMADVVTLAKGAK